ncbi:ArsR family transcriptional regulator [bacterium]|nr:MAG: ArsR family transcriptional regulator [bacterium]
MSQRREIKDRLFEQFARIGQAMSSSKRLELLDLLSQCEKDVETLASNSGMSVANTSRHLLILKAAGLVESRKEGVHNFYHLANQEVVELYCGLRELAERQLADVERIVDELYPGEERMEPVDRKQLIKLAKAGTVTVLDVRPEDEFRAAHLPHAISVPLPKLKNYLKELPKHRQVVAYCRGPYCLMASEAIKLLQSKGYKAIRLGEGIVEWQAAGLPLVHGS